MLGLDFIFAGSLVLDKSSLFSTSSAEENPRIIVALKYVWEIEKGSRYSGPLVYQRMKQMRHNMM